MKSVYESVQDIDLFIGGVTEHPMPGAVLGPTFANIFAHQFTNLRRTDRYFYNFNVNQPTGFSSGMIKYSKKILYTLTIGDSFPATYDHVHVHLGFYQVNWQKFKKFLWRESFATTATAP